MIARLADPDTKASLVKYLQESSGLGSLDGFMWTYLESESNKHLEGMAFPDIAADRGVSVEEMVCDIMLEEKLMVGVRGIPTSSVRLWRQVEEDVMDLLARDDFMVGNSRSARFHRDGNRSVNGSRCEIIALCKCGFLSRRFCCHRRIEFFRPLQ